jgi:transposase-like protein
MKGLSVAPASGTPLMDDLPPPDIARWVIRRKAEVVAAVENGRITVKEACRIYQLSEEELLSWQRAFEIYGLPGLRTTRIQQYRKSRAARPRSVSPKLPAKRTPSAVF